MQSAPNCTGGCVNLAGPAQGWGAAPPGLGGQHPPGTAPSSPLGPRETVGTGQAERLAMEAHLPSHQGHCQTPDSAVTEREAEVSTVSNKDI